MNAPGDCELLRRVERFAAFVFVLLKLYVLYDAWGVLQGFDPASWLDVFRATHWFEPLPSPRAFFASYHPPLSYLLARIVYWFYPHETDACMIVSTLAMIGGFFALRSALRHVGWLLSLPGVWLLYGGTSVPLLVWLGLETGSYDGLLFFWFTLALSLAVRLLWQPRPLALWRDARAMVLTTLLGLVLAAGMLTKFTAFMAFGVPFLIVLVRRGPRALVREVGAPAAACVIAVIVIAPLFHQRYWIPERRLMPSALDWQIPEELEGLRADRDAHRLRFLRRMLRSPERPIVGTNQPVVDSFVHTIWLHTWKRDETLGGQAKLSAQVSDFYVRVFAFLLPAGTILFLIRRRKIPEDWRHLGWVLLVLAAVFCGAALYFAWQYPVFGWRAFKGKYICPAMLWIGYATAPVLLGAWFPAAGSRLHRYLSTVALLALVLFVFLNHLLPVY